MNDKFIIAGTSIVGFAGGLLFTSMIRPFRMKLIAGLAAGTLGLIAKYSSLQKGESLSKKDVILIGGAGLIGGFAGGKLAYSILLPRAIKAFASRLLAAPFIFLAHSLTVGLGDKKISHQFGPSYFKNYEDRTLFSLWFCK